MHEVVAWCLKHGLFVVINTQPPQWRRDPAQFWKSEAMQKKYAEAWVEIARHYAAKGAAARVAYDLFNEPHGPGSAENWPRVARELTRAIRGVDRVHPVVVEPAAWGNSVGFKSFEPTGDEGTVYSFHFYAPFDFTHQRAKGGTLKATPDQTKAMKYPGVITPWWEGAKGELWNRERIREEIAPALEFRRKHNVVLWLGEFGVTRWANGAREWLRDCLETWEAGRIGWCYYSYREWHAMDLEKPADTRDSSVPRGETDALKLFKGFLARGAAKAP